MRAREVGRLCRQALEDPPFHPLADSAGPLSSRIPRPSPIPRATCSRAWSSRDAGFAGNRGINAPAWAGARASATRNSSSANCARTLSSGAVSPGVPGPRGQRARPVALGGGQPGNPGVDHALDVRAAVDARHVPRCGQQVRGGPVFAPLQMDPRLDHAGEDLSYPCGMVSYSAAAAAMRSSAAAAETRSPCRNATQAGRRVTGTHPRWEPRRVRVPCGGPRPQPGYHRPADALRLPAGAVARASGTADPARPRHRPPGGPACCAPAQAPMLPRLL